MNHLQKMLALFLLSSAGLSSFPAEQPRRAVSGSRIEAVTVYRDKALVQRLFDKDLESGEYTLNIDNLPQTVVDESVRVTAHGGAPVRIHDIKVQSVHLEESLNTRIRELEGKRETVQKTMLRLDDRQNVVNRQLDFIKLTTGLLAKDTDGVSVLQKKTAQEWDAILGFIADKSQKLFLESRLIEDEKGALQKQLAAINHDLSIESTSGAKVRKTIQVDFAVTQTGNTKLEVFYLVPGASWIPYYDLRFSSDKPDVVLTYQALVRQATGEDWEKVRLTLSTSNASLAREAPKLTPFYLEKGSSDRAGEGGIGTLQGKVTDTDNNPLPGVTIELKGDNFRQMSVSNANGDFHFIDMTGGAYTMTASLQGFKTNEQSIKIRNDRLTAVTITMAQNEITEQVTVVGESPMIDVKTAAKEKTFTRGKDWDVKGGSGGQTAPVSSRSTGIGAGSASGKGGTISVSEKPLESASAEQVLSKPVAALFAIAREETIPSNDLQQKVSIGVINLGSVRQFQAVPKLTEKMFLHADITNTPEYPLLPGKAGLYYDGDFLSNTMLPQVNQGETFPLSLGEQSGIRVKRQVADKKEETSGLFSRKIERTYTIMIRLENFIKSRETVMLRDQIPVTKDNDIQIELLSASPQPQKPTPEELEKKDGGMTWLFTLDPGQKKEIRFQYKMIFPKGKIVFDPEE